MKTYLTSIAILTLCLIVLVGCTGSSDDGVFEIATTSTMITDMVKTIVGEAAGDKLVVNGLIPAGVDPHSFVLPGTAIVDLENADLIIYNGMFLEEKMTSALKSRGDSALAIIDILPKEQLFTAEKIGEDHGDPHVWGNAELWSKAIDGVVAKLSQLLPEHKPTFVKNGDAYRKELLELHQWATNRIQEIPEQNRTLITSHDAFGYLGAAYDINVVGIKGLSTNDQAGGGDITATVTFIKEKNVKAIFPESATNNAEIQTVAKQAKVTIGNTLFADSCGAAGDVVTYGDETYDKGTYIGMMKHNINSIVDALK